MKVYRLQDAKGYGAYETNNWTDRNLDEFERVFGYIFHDHLPRHPGPMRLPDEAYIRLNKFRYLHRNYRYGFESAGAFDAWFTPAEVDWLIANVGLEIAIYDVPPEGIFDLDGKQCVFAFDLAKIAETV